MKAYRVSAEGFDDGIACGESASKVRSLAIRRLRSVYPSYTWKQGLQIIQVRREPTFDDWADRRKKASIVTEDYFDQKRQ